ncbi:hypothetical protein [Andreprevotia chitinilytica]|uniref:hypothetical protein n=1 Tax=Andreprevotia chitinilytica TaxID=396808 RepID=UPI00055821C1|nr:hypothetical protein [Andreprevotia chitinilytica]
MFLLLNLPDLDPRLADSVETNPKKLRDWLIALPMTNVIEAGRLVYDALSACNRTKIDPDERFKLLEQYRTTLDLLAGGFESMYTTHGLPMKESARQVANLARTLWQELSVGYKRALIDKVEKRSLFGSNKLTSQLIQIVLLLHYRVLKLCSRIYTALPEGVWQESHQLFRYAAENKLLEEPEEELTISHQYKRLLMLALADPMRYAPSELDKVIELTDNYASLIKFQAVTQLSSTAGFFLVRLDADEGPSFVGARTADDYNGLAMLIDTIELGKKLLRSLASLEQKVPQAQDRLKALMWLELLRRVSRQWTIAPKRLFNRMQTDSEIEICLGLAVSAQCAGMESLDPSSSAEPASPEGVRWRILNESPGGYAVQTQGAPTERVRAGEIVAIRPVYSEDWMVASVRWLQQADESRIEMGLQVMSARAQGVLLKPTIGTQDSRYQPALLLPEITALNQPSQIAAAKGMYSPLRELSVLTPDGELLLRATKLVEQQMGYDLFQFQAS